MKKLFALLVLLALSPQVARGCAVCFGDKDSPMTHGMNMGILTLLLVLIPILALFAGFFIYLWWRSHHPLPHSDSLWAEGDAATE